ncbi:hypothetical protein AB0G73_31055 [Streptomyces sp. NPDC020719]|uniref:hypothetical protein n=1 Tax=Streptomyces sp. NPDC020719 TaxID=3154896 RepID=UPI0033FBDCA7
MRRHVRTGAGAVALAACLALAGCSSSSSGGDKPKDKNTGGTQSASPSGSGGGQSGGDSAKVSAKDIAGAWATIANGKPTALVISGTTVALGGEHTCTGKVNDNGMAMIELKCADGNTERVAGMPKLSADGKTLTVKWESGTTDKFAKSALDGKLPTSVPTTGLPTP